jgi:DNA-binding HxlR family transcriptional regulator
VNANNGTVSQWDTREGCQVRQILDQLSGKWSLMLIALLDGRIMRFNELGRAVDGVSPRVLAVKLRQLERDGVVRRTVYPQVPPRVEYELTDVGSALHETLQPLVEWVRTNEIRIRNAQAEFDARN